MTQLKPTYDKEDQYRRVVPYLMQGEMLHAVFDCKGAGTGFVGITNLRLIFYDQGVLLKKKSMVSIPYHQIIGVASADEGIIFQTSEITLITAAGRFSFEFRGADKAHLVYSIVTRYVLGIE